MILHHIGQTHSVLNQFIREIRDVHIQKDAMRFRRNMERIGEILAYEMSKEMKYETAEVTTPLGTKTMALPAENPVICSVLRAGIPLHSGILNYFDRAENAFISAYRRHSGNGDFDIHVEYAATPSLQGKILLLADPMLATGRSIVATYKALLEFGKPSELHILAVLGATDGIGFVEQSLPADTRLWIAAIDDTLNAKSYIVPGLGDAGDLAFGVKSERKKTQ